MIVGGSCCEGGASNADTEDREEISRGIAEELTGEQIAARIGRCPSVVCREIGRHGGRERYRAAHADRGAARARRRPKCRKLESDLVLRLIVCGLLKRDWSPEAAACRLPID